MKIAAVTASDVRSALLLREEIALFDLRHEAAFATGHPLFAANMAEGRIAIDVAESAMKAYLDWEYGLVEQLRRDATHGFYVI
jgi:hypothetical protein